MSSGQFGRRSIECLVVVFGLFIAFRVVTVYSAPFLDAAELMSHGAV